MTPTTTETEEQSQVDLVLELDCLQIIEQMGGTIPWNPLWLSHVEKLVLAGYTTTQLDQ